MNQIVDNVDTVESLDQRVDIAEITLRHLGGRTPGNVVQLLWGAGQSANPMPLVQQSRHQARTDIAGGTGYQAMNLFVRHKSLCSRQSIIRSRCHKRLPLSLKRI